MLNKKVVAIAQDGSSSIKPQNVVKMKRQNFHRLKTKI